jgi:hypothetical protein
MIIPITRETLEELIPVVATSSQYLHYWGDVTSFLKRALISFVMVVGLFILGAVLGDGAHGFILISQVIGGLYWFWGPVYWASLNNQKYRSYKYAGFFRGEILDVFITDEIVEAIDRINDRGQLVMVENRKRYINVEVGDETGFSAIVQTPLKRIHKGLNPGESAELVVLSNDADLYRIKQISDAFFPRTKLWVGSYPCLRRDAFEVVSDRLSNQRY